MLFDPVSSQTKIILLDLLLDKVWTTAQNMPQWCKIEKMDFFCHLQKNYLLLIQVFSPAIFCDFLQFSRYFREGNKCHDVFFLKYISTWKGRCTTNLFTGFGVLYRLALTCPTINSQLSHKTNPPVAWGEIWVHLEQESVHVEQVGTRPHEFSGAPKGGIAGRLFGDLCEPNWRLLNLWRNITWVRCLHFIWWLFCLHWQPKAGCFFFSFADCTHAAGRLPGR